MKLEVGMYVKFKNGNIGQLKQIDESLFYPQYYFDNIIDQVPVSQYYYLKDVYDCNENNLKKIIKKDKKPSFKIIDLIEVGDIVTVFSDLHDLRGNETFNIRDNNHLKHVKFGIEKRQSFPM